MRIQEKNRIATTATALLEISPVSLYTWLGYGRRIKGDLPLLEKIFVSVVTDCVYMYMCEYGGIVPKNVDFDITIFGE